MVSPGIRGRLLPRFHVTTLGPQAVDVFYVQESGAGALSETRAADAAHAVRAALRDTVTLEKRA